jgi:hypothetical protein
MTRKTESEINFNIINENFPVAGEDNDTQVFRDNFDSIKNNFRLAQEELTDLLENSARTDENNNFGNSTIEDAVFLNTKYAKFDTGNIDETTTGISGSSESYTIDYENGSYQIIRVQQRTTPLNIFFQNLPVNNDRNIPPYGVGKITLEIWGDGSITTLNFLGGGNGTKFRKKGFPLSNGQADQEPVPVSINGLSNQFPSGGPIFIEIWRHSGNFIFMHYLGTFNE